MKFIFNLLARTLAVLVTTYIIPGVKVDGFLTAVVIVVVLGVLNAVIKPVLLLLTLPVNFLSLGLFTFVINGLIVFLASKFITGFSIDSLVTGILFSIVLSLVNWFFNRLKHE